MGQAGGGHDVGDADAVEPALAEQGRRDLDDALTVEPGLLLRNSRHSLILKFDVSYKCIVSSKEGLPPAFDLRHAVNDNRPACARGQERRPAVVPHARHPGARSPDAPGTGA
jgi:hypothetical protein